MSGVSFIVTVFDKRDYLPRVVAALARQAGPFEREFVFVDDGSADGSGELIAELTRGWRDTVVILRQANGGASAATNAGARRASHTWLKLVDGDDLLVPGATAHLLEAALARDFALPPVALERDGLARFIRNCPCNSSTI